MPRELNQCKARFLLAGQAGILTHINLVAPYLIKENARAGVWVHAWTLASKRHRAKEPLCRQCKREGIISKGELVHHNPPLDELKARGLNPLDDKYLETLCFNCHQKELRRKRG